MAEKMKFRFYYLIPLAVVLIFSAANFLPEYRIVDNRLYDLLLNVKPAIEEDESILLLNIDDQAISQVGTWPWSRSVMADGLILLTEFNADSVVFDIEYVDPSPRGVDSEYLENTMPRLMTERMEGLKRDITDLFTAIQEGYIPLDEAESYIQELAGITENVRDELLEAARSIARDNDEYLGRAVSFFGNAWVTVNMLPDEVELIRVTDEHKDYVQQNIALEDIEVNGFSPPLQAPSIQPTIMPILSQAAGAGYPNVVVDEDGVRRRIDIVAAYKDGIYGQLVFSPLRKKLGDPDIVFEKDRLILKEAAMPDGGRRDITVPLSYDGRMLINWPAKSFDESFRHLSFSHLVVHDRLEQNIVKNLSLMEEAGYLNYYQGDYSIPEIHRYAAGLREDLLAGAADEAPTREALDEYREVRSLFFDESRSLVEGDTEKALLAEIDNILQREDLPPSLKEEYELVRDDVVQSFAALRTDIERLMPVRDRLAAELNGAFVIIGQTGISTTDIGVTPFEKAYMNVGTHAAVANTILNEDFLVELHWIYGVLAALVLAFLSALVIKNLKPLASILVGLAFLIGTLLAGGAFFLATGVYLPLMTPLLAVFLSFISISLIKFLKTEGEKSFLRNAFGRYLSQDVIKQLISDPDRLNLGGEKKELTALFTDIKGFSTISEDLDPTELVKLLNHYLTGMSDIILDLHGTIDKYEGDAIIAFFGAPIDFEDHAYRACMSAIRMRRVERELNERFLAEQISPSPLMTRVGINTGDMVVGNMGTLQKMDYTIMGNAVNLASRLEGINKQYGTWILMSEISKEKAGDHFVTRQLDRVRVVGIHKPVRLYELIEEKGKVDDQTTELLDIFHEGLSLFEAKEWKQAIEVFDRALHLDPEDGPSATFKKRCTDYLKKPPSENWDGIFTLNIK